MGRRGGGGRSGGGRSRFTGGARRSASTSTATKSRSGSSSSSSSSSSRGTPANTQQKQPASQTQQRQPAFGGGGGGGFWSGVAQTALGVGAGHVLSHAVIGGWRALSGGAEMSREEEERVARAAEGPCKAHFEAMQRCMENTEDKTQCSWAFDFFRECQDSYERHGGGA